MGTILGFETGVSMPQLFGGDSMVLTVFLIVLFVGIIGGGIWWVYWNMKVYNRKIEVYENIAGLGYRLTKTDRARLIKVGDGGEEVLYLRKNKCYRTAYGRKMGNNLYWFCVGQDGYWYNSILGDLDAKMGMLDIEPIDRDMRMMSVSIRRNIESRYRKRTVEKVVAVAVTGLVIMSLILVVGGWYMFDKMAETAAEINKGVESVIDAQEIQKELLATASNVASSSGLS